MRCRVSMMSRPGSEGAARTDRPALRFPGWKLDWGAGILGLSLLFVALRWNSFNVPLIRDEGEYAYAAQLLRQGIPPYEHAFLQKPPMVVYTYALAQTMAPNLFWSPRVLAYLCVAGATCLLGWIARREFGPGVAFPAMSLFTPMVLLPGIDQFAANTEMFLLLPLLGLVAVFVHCRRVGGGATAWFLAGVLGAVILWYKYTAFPVVLVVFAAWSVEQWRVHRSARGLCWRWSCGLAGAALTSVAVLAFFLLRDGGKHLWECTVQFNRFYATSSDFGWLVLGPRLWMLLKNWWVLFLLLGVLVLAREARVWFWAGLFLAAWVATGASRYAHYYVLVMPFWALLAAVALDRVARWAAARLSWTRTWARPGLIGLVVLLVCLPDLAWVTRTPAAFAAGKLTGDNPFLESVVVARRLAEMTSPQDYVFVAGSEPQILYYARRLSATRFVIVYPLMIHTPLAATYQQEAINELEKHPPAVVVLSRLGVSWLTERDSPPGFFKYLNQSLARDYRLVGAYVRNGQGGRWQQPLPPGEENKASLILFRRKGA